MVEDAMNGKIHLDPFITHRLPLEQINDAFELMHQGNPSVLLSTLAITDSSASGFSAGAFLNFLE